MFRTILTLRKLYFSRSKLVIIIDRRIRLLLAALLGTYIWVRRASWKAKDNEVLSKSRSVLILAFYGIGDSLMLTPAIKALKVLRPQIKITIVTKNEFVDVFNNNKHVFEVVGISKEEFLSTAKKLKNRKFDLYLSFIPSLEYLIFAWFLRPKYAFGYLTGYRSIDAIGFNVGNVGNKSINAVTRNLRVVEVLTGKELIGDSEMISMEYVPSDAARIEAGRLLVDFRKENRILIGFNPNKTSSWGGMGVWPIENFAEVANELLCQDNIAIVIFGDARDLARTQDLTAKICSLDRVLNMSGKSSLAVTAAAIEQCALFITTDSGLMHLALALKCPVISLFGFSDPESFNSSKDNWVLFGKRGCSPCIKNDFLPLTNYPAKCPDPSKCMREIDPKMVIIKAKEILKNAHQ